MHDHLFKNRKTAVAVNVSATEEQTKTFNNQLAEVKIIKRLPERTQMDPFILANPPTGCATDGTPVPTFGEMFFPTGKTEIYNILYRYYHAEAGNSHGLLTPEWKSRIMKGFIETYYEHIFQHKLEEIFEQQLKCMAFTSQIPWKPEHWNAPWLKLMELRKKWLEKKEKNEASSPSN